MNLHQPCIGQSHNGFTSVVRHRIPSWYYTHTLGLQTQLKAAQTFQGSKTLVCALRSAISPTRSVKTGIQ